MLYLEDACLLPRYLIDGVPEYGCVVHAKTADTTYYRVAEINIIIVLIIIITSITNMIIFQYTDYKKKC